MKGLKKLVLAAAVVAPFAQAEMTSIDDAMMSEMTGQAGVTIDVNLAMTIGEIQYVDTDGQADNFQSNAALVGFRADDKGSVSLKNIQVGELSSTGGVLAATSITGITIDADATRGLVINFGQIGGDNLAAFGVTDGKFWTGLDVRADFAINGTTAGSFAIDNFSNFVPNAMVVEGATKFGIFTNMMDTSTGFQVTDFTNAVAANFASGPTAGNEAQSKALAASTLKNDMLAGAKVDAWVAVRAGGSDGAQGLSIDASVGGLIERMAFVDDGNEVGIHNFAMFDVDGSGNVIGVQVTGMTIDVVSHAAAASGQALKIVPGNISGTFAMGDIYVGNADTGSLGSVAIKDINLTGTEMFIYGH